MPQILLLRADIYCFHIGDIFKGKHVAVNHHEGSLQIYQSHGGHHCAHVDVTSDFVLAYLHGCHSGHGRPSQKAWWCQYSGNVGSCPWGVISHQWVSNFLKARWWHFSWAPEVSGSWSSTTWHSCQWEHWDEAGLESPWSPLTCSSIRQQWALLLLELQLWQHHLGLPKLKGTCPTEATRQDGWSLVQLGYSWPLVPFLLLVVTGGVVGIAGSLAGIAGGVVGTAGSLPGTAGGVLGLVSSMGICLVSVVPGCAGPLTSASGALWSGLHLQGWLNHWR